MEDYPTSDFDKIDDEIASAFRETVHLPSEYRNDARETVFAAQKLANSARNYEGVYSDKLREDIEDSYRGIIVISNHYDDLVREVRDLGIETANKAAEGFNEVDEMLENENRSNQSYRRSFNQLSESIETAQSLKKIGESLSVGALYPTLAHICMETDNSSNFLERSESLEPNTESVAKAIGRIT